MTTINNDNNQTNEKKPYKCPVCDGTGKRAAFDSHLGEVPAQECHACKGEGVLWK